MALEPVTLDGTRIALMGIRRASALGNALTGGFQPFAAICLGPIQALALSDSTIYAGDLVGGVARFDLATGDFLGASLVPDSVTAMAWDGDAVLVSENGGTIWRLDPTNGAILATLTAPIFVDAMDILATPGDLDGDGHVGNTDLLLLPVGLGARAPTRARPPARPTSITIGASASSSS